MNNYLLRPATAADAEGMLKVYAQYVRTTAATFEYEPPDIAEFISRIEKIQTNFPWLVCECNGEVAGYVYASKHRERVAYQWSPESTIYIAEAHHGTGIARIMYEALFDILKYQGYMNVYASVLATNVNSNRFHKAMGFEDIGTFRNVGYKLGAWHSNNWYQLHLAAHTLNPLAPRLMSEVVDTAAFNTIIALANEKLAVASNNKAAHN
jgi:Sortase and related acyltransferases